MRSKSKPRTGAKSVRVPNEHLTDARKNVNAHRRKPKRK